MLCDVYVIVPHRRWRGSGLVCVVAVELRAGMDAAHENDACRPRSRERLAKVGEGESKIPQSSHFLGRISKSEDWVPL